MNKLSVNHLLGIKNLTKNDIKLIFNTADNFKKIINQSIKKVPSLRDITIANLFFENSTRTKLSFEIAAKRSPVIKHREIKIGQKASATSWLSYDTEFIFGFEPPDKISYWNKVIKTSEESSANTSKIIAFSFPDSEKFNQSIKEKVNIIDLSRAELASLAAGNTVIQESDDEGKVFSEIAPELESIWKRITRSA